MLQNDLLLRAAKGEPTERTPVWLMRQAGRILPEYRQVRASVSGFKELVETPALAAEVTIQPVDLLGVDAAIIFSDILVIPEAMGLTYEMIEQRGPHFPKTIETKADVDAIRVAQGHDLDYVLKAIQLTKTQLAGRVPLIGFAGAPWTILAYMVEGHGSKTFSKARRFLYTEPALSHALLVKITESTINYLKAQIDAGADLIQLFDSWAGILPPAQYRTFSAHYLRLICDALKAHAPHITVTVFAKGAFFALEDFAASSCDVIGLDWNMDIATSRLQTKGKTLQGNMDPCLLYANQETIQEEAEKMLRAFGSKGYIANLGHGLYPDTDPKNVKFFVDCVKNFKHESHTQI